MRKIVESHMKIGEVDISQINFDLRCRDEIPKLLMGLQYLYCEPTLREKVFSILEELIPQEINRNLGRKGMELWKILVLGTIRLNCNWDYDKLHDIANNHAALRKMLGHSEFEAEPFYYPLQTIKDNVALFTPEILDKINLVVVEAGHNLVKKKDEKPELNGRCDSFVVETDVHYPTDINLLFDAIRKVMFLYSLVCETDGFTFWRQWKHNLKQIKKRYRKAQKTKHSSSKNEHKKSIQAQKIKDVHCSSIKAVADQFDRIEQSRSLFANPGLSTIVLLAEIDRFIKYGRIFIDQINRRIINDEKIPHDEKIFSIFQPHTEWISKGKAGVSQELGLRVSIVEDQYGFVLHHHVMEKQIDSEGAVPLIRETKERFPGLTSSSFDKGYWSPKTFRDLSEELDMVAMRKRGRCTRAEAERESSPEFKSALSGHPAVESGINALENHGLDRCLDHGINGFKRYVARAIVGRNIQKLGHILQHREFKREQRKEKVQETWRRKKLDLAS